MSAYEINELLPELTTPKGIFEDRFTVDCCIRF